MIQVSFGLFEYWATEVTTSVGYIYTPDSTFNSVAGKQINMIDQRTYIYIQITPLSMAFTLAIVFMLR